MKVKSLSRAQLVATPWTAAHQAPPSMGFPRQEYWSGVPLPSPYMVSRLFNKLLEISIRIDFLLDYFAEGKGTPVQYSCLQNPMDGGAWKAAVHGVAEGRTRLSHFTFTFHFHALEKKMATHSSVLACRVPGTGEPAGLPSMGSHSVGHD